MTWLRSSHLGSEQSLSAQHQRVRQCYRSEPTCTIVCGPTTFGPYVSIGSYAESRDRPLCAAGSDVPRQREKSTAVPCSCVARASSCYPVVRAHASATCWSRRVFKAAHVAGCSSVHARLVAPRRFACQAVAVHSLSCVYVCAHDGYLVIVHVESCLTTRSIWNVNKGVKWRLRAPKTALLRCASPARAYCSSPSHVHSECHWSSCSSFL